MAETIRHPNPREISVKWGQPMRRISFVHLLVLFCSLMPMPASAQSFEQIPGKLASISLGGTSHGAVNVWGITSNNYLYEFNGLAFQNIPGTFTQVAVDGNAIFVIDTNQNVFELDPDAAAFVQVPGKLTQVAAHGGAAWEIDANQNVFIFDGQIFIQVPGKLSQIAVDGGSVWGISASHNVYVFDDAQLKFVQVPGTLTSIAVGAFGGEVWGIDLFQNIFHFDYGSQVFVQVPGKLASIAVGGYLFPGIWGIDAAGNVYKFNGTAFEQVSGQLKQIAVFDGSVWGISSSQDVLRLEP